MFVLLTIPLQWLAYTLLIRFAFKLSLGRSVLAALIRVCVGSALYWGLKMALPLSFFATHFVSAPIAWALVAPVDPRRSWRRLLYWVALGTAVTVALNYVFFGMSSGDDYFQESLHLIPG
jgi:hypothetical protein